MDIEAGKTLTNEEVIRELLELLKKNAMKEQANDVFEICSYVDGVVCASGSSPAYVYMFIEALADSVVKYGIKRDDAYKMVAQTVLGSAKMVLESGEHPAVLKDKVCSPGGTTIQAVSALEENGFRNALIKATDACYDKCTSIK